MNGRKPSTLSRVEGRLRGAISESGFTRKPEEPLSLLEFPSRPMVCQPAPARKSFGASIDSFHSIAIETPVMKDAVLRLNAEYSLNLSEAEIEVIAKQAEAAQRLFQKLFAVDVEGVATAIKIDPEERQ